MKRVLLFPQTKIATSITDSLVRPCGNPVPLFHFELKSVNKLVAIQCFLDTPLFLLYTLTGRCFTFTTFVLLQTNAFATYPYP
jgi:hypothetical protein